MRDTRINGARAWGATPWHGGQLRAAESIPSRADVVIVGGGLTGCSAAYHLSRLGIRPVLLEADLVIKRNSNDPNSTQYRIYELSDFGKKFLTKVLEWA